MFLIKLIIGLFAIVVFCVIVWIAIPLIVVGCLFMLIHNFFKVMYGIK